VKNTMANRGFGDNEYKPILDQARKETTARGKCDWILATLEIMTANHLPHIEKEIILLRNEQHQRFNRLLAAVGLLAALILATNPQLIVAVGKVVVGLMLGGK